MAGRPFDPAGAAERAMDHCCEGDPWPTGRNLAVFVRCLAALAARRCVSRLRNQPRGIVRFRSDSRYGGRRTVETSR